METPQLLFKEMPSYFSALTSILPPLPDYSKMTEEELLAELKKSPHFDKMVFPNAWYSKYDLPEKKCMNPKEYIKESPWMKTSQHYYIKREDIPAKPGGVRPVLPAPEVPVVTLLQNSFSDATDQTESSNPPETHES